MDQTDPVREKPADRTDVDFTINQLKNGATLKEIQGRLVERGLDQVTASAIVREVLIHEVYGEAIALLNSGMSPEDTEKRLVGGGLEPQLAKGVVAAVLADGQIQAPSATGRKLALQLLGGLIFVVGVGLFIGNVTGLFRTFPFAGFIVMGIGGAIVGAVQKAG